MIALINVAYYDFKHYRSNQFILFEEKIYATGPMSAFVDQGYEVIDCTGQLVLPGLINGHHHIYSTFARGLALEFNPQNFQEILDQLWWKIDGALDKEQVYYSGIVSGVEALQSGVTTVIDHHASGIELTGSLEVLKKAVCDVVGLRGIFCFETSDRFDVDLCIKENLAFAQKYKTTKVAGLFGLHAGMSLSEESLAKVGEVLGDIPIHIHVAESQVDEALSLERYGERIIPRLHRHGLLTPNSLLAHCLYINKDEARLIAKQKCQVVLNVTSNMNNGVGLPDYHLLKDANIPVLIGNDGIASGMTQEWLTMVYAMHHRDLTPTTFGLDQVLEMIQKTYAYASKILGCRLGRIEKGYMGDLMRIPYTPPTPMTTANAFSHICYGLASYFRPEQVWVAGISKVEGYKVVPELMVPYKEAYGSAVRLWQRLGVSEDYKEGVENES
jgi:cytosine/adenosine deaminase-related metal-dependent hydrolase